MDIQELLLRHVINPENLQFLSRSHPYFCLPNPPFQKSDI